MWFYLFFLLCAISSLQRLETTWLSLMFRTSFLMLYLPLPPKNGHMCFMDQHFLLTNEQKPPWEVDKQTDINRRMASNSPKRLTEVILPKSGKERQDVGDTEKGAAFQARQETLTYGNRIKGGHPVPAQLFETWSPWSLSHLILWPLLWENSKVMVDGNVSGRESTAERMRIHCGMSINETLGFDFFSRFCFVSLFSLFFFFFFWCGPFLKSLLKLL